MPHKIVLYNSNLHLLSFLTIALLYLLGARVEVKWWLASAQLQDHCPPHNRCHRVGLDRSLKQQSALLFSFLFETLFALACVSMSVAMWRSTQTPARLASLKKAEFLAAHQSLSWLDSYALMKWTYQLLSRQCANLTDEPECGQPAKQIYMRRYRYCTYRHKKLGSFPFGKRCPSGRQL